MSSAAPTYSLPAYGSLPVPAAAFEVLAYLAVVAVATLCFLAGWLTVNDAVILTVVLLTTLIVMSWVHLGQGRHPCFLFLCMLTMFQGGRLVGYCLGTQSEPMRITVMTPSPFNLARDQQGLVLLCLTLSAICVYAPCRWMYRSFRPPDPRPVRQYLPYLYIVFIVGLPFLLYKNYRFYEYAQQHGGYLFLFADQRALASSVPLLVRSVSAILFPVFLAIYTFETRKKYLFFATLLYFVTVVFILLLGSRGAVFQLIVTLWYVTRVKSPRKPRLFLLGVTVILLALVASLARAARENPGDPAYLREEAAAPVHFVALQGSSIDVTQVAVKYREQFSPYIASYFLHELQNAYTTFDTAHYSRGEVWEADVAVLLNPRAFEIGFGAGGSYIGEAYVIGGIAGVVVGSLLIGGGLILLHRMSRRADLLFVAATLLFAAVWFPRGSLFSWLSAFSRNMIAIVLLLLGWVFFRLIISVRHDSSDYAFLGT